MNFTIDTRELLALRDRFAEFSDRRFAAGMATALTRTAVAVKDAERREMVDSFDRPTPYTLNSIFVEPANATRLQARVGIKDEASGGRAPVSWLRWQISGGDRRWTGFERALIRGGAMPDDLRAIPGKFARLDAFGNVSRGQMQQILSQLRIDTGRAGSVRTVPRLAFEDTRKDRQRKQAAVRRSRKSAGGEYVAFPRGRGKLLPGLYLIRNSNFGRADPKPVFIFVRRATYQPIFDFEYAAQVAIQRTAPGAVRAALAEQLQRLRAKQAGAAA